MPVATQTQTQSDTIQSIKSTLGSLSLNGSAPAEVDLRQYASFDSTPFIGTEFRETPGKDGKPVLSVREVLADEAKLKALGKLVSERGVVFFRGSPISTEEQKTLVSALSRLSGAVPASHGLHIHPLTLSGSELGDEISVISNTFVFDPKFKFNPQTKAHERRLGKNEWHSDVTFENTSSDYASLVIRNLPSVGGDTLWASAYEAYDRLSPAYRTFLEGLTATHVGQHFLEQLAAHPDAKITEPRGSPENVGTHLSTVHPVIRTNPVTGWKGVFVNRVFTKKINELSEEESARTLNFLADHIESNHDLQVRFRWEEDSLAIWDNRSTFHAATRDVENEERIGTRSVSVGERPYFDPKSTSRREALVAAQTAAAA